MVGLITITFVVVDAETLKALLKALVRLHVEYTNQVWDPHLVKDLEVVENVQWMGDTVIRWFYNLKKLIMKRD